MNTGAHRGNRRSNTTPFHQLTHFIILNFKIGALLKDSVVLIREWIEIR
jgi:hypothetical protein